MRKQVKSGEFFYEIPDITITTDTMIRPQYTIVIKSNGNFLFRLWFLMSAPFIWLIKGEVKIK